MRVARVPAARDEFCSVRGSFCLANGYSLATPRTGSSRISGTSSACSSGTQTGSRRKCACRTPTRSLACTTHLERRRSGTTRPVQHRLSGAATRPSRSDQRRHVPPVRRRPHRPTARPIRRRRRVVRPASGEHLGVVGQCRPSAVRDVAHRIAPRRSGGARLPASMTRAVVIPPILGHPRSQMLEVTRPHVLSVMWQGAARWSGSFGSVWRWATS